jgi:hypothetical protein
MKKGDLLIVNKKYSVSESGKISARDTQAQARFIAAVYDDGSVRDSVGDVWRVKPDGINRFVAIA